MSNSEPVLPAHTTTTASLLGGVLPSVATELRRRRQLLGWSQGGRPDAAGEPDGDL
ncbi:MAG: hypothetical protein JF887_04750 [Candidatus Dormibacteraeota bacterium]|uniref:Uncharacterized protein n=1 Tax=Candidatus Amunia macphersoniae TaxID=3127014 RepID=A0A934KMJ4_9BACT|nr:hypothetical protein [Candidatus Dormibacteraeota bacterium]